MYLQPFSNDNVYVRTKDRRTTPRPNASAQSSTMSGCGTDGKERSVKTSIYFDAQSFENAEH